MDNIAPDYLGNVEVIPYSDRWMSLRREGTIRALDKGIVAFTKLAERYNRSSQKGKASVLSDIEWNAVAVTRVMPKIIALVPDRRIAMPFPPGLIFVKATAQYLTKFDSAVGRAMYRGAKVATAAICDESIEHMMTHNEQDYRDWAVLRLSRHMVLDFNYWDDDKLRNMLYRLSLNYANPGFQNDYH